MTSTQKVPDLIVRGGRIGSVDANGEPQMRRYGQLLGTFRGLMSLWTESGRWLVPAGHSAWIPPQHPYSVHSHEPFSGWAASILKEPCLPLPQKPCSFATSGLLREAILRVRGSQAGVCDAEQNLIAMIICQEIRKLPQTCVGVALPSDRRLLRIATAIADNPADNRRLEDWATWTGMSTRTLVRRFVQETGLSFTEWRQQARLVRAIEWLAGGMSVTTVALDLGYNTVSAFIAMFRRAVGMTPTAYLDAIAMSQARGPYADARVVRQTRHQTCAAGSSHHAPPGASPSIHVGDLGPARRPNTGIPMGETLP